MRHFGGITMRVWARLAVVAISWGAISAEVRGQEPDEEEPGGDPTGEPVVVEEPAPTGEEAPPTEPPAAGEEPAPTEPAATEPAATEPAATEPAPAELDPEVVALFRRRARQAAAGVRSQLRLVDFKALRVACPQASAEEIIACINAEERAEQIALAYLRGVPSAMLANMDAALPARLDEDALVALADRCKEAIGPWAVCTIDKGPDDATCAEAEDALAFASPTTTRSTPPTWRCRTTRRRPGVTASPTSSCAGSCRCPPSSRWPPSARTAPCRTPRSSTASTSSR
jgi:hypothetical protein